MYSERCEALPLSGSNIAIKGAKGLVVSKADIEA